MARAGLTIQRLTLAGAEIADEDGFEQVTVSALARRFEVRAASVYSHLDGASDLRTRIAVLALEEMADLADDALAGRSGADAVVALGGVYRRYARAHPGRYAAAGSPAAVAPAAASAGTRHQQLARAALRSYRLGEPDETHAIRLIGGLFRGFVDLEASGAFARSTPASEESWARVLDGLSTLLTAWSGAEPPG